MKVAVVHHFKEQLTIEDLPVPKLGADDALVKIQACGSHNSSPRKGNGEARREQKSRPNSALNCWGLVGLLQIAAQQYNACAVYSSLNMFRI